MLIFARDAASVMMSVALETCPRCSLTGHCLVSGCVGTGALLTAVPVADFSANSFSFDICFVTSVMASRCVSANSDHFFVRTSMDCDRA